MRIAALICREGSAFDGLRQVARIQFERHQVAPVARILEKHGIPPARSRELATQFVAMACGEWQRRLLLGENVMTGEQMTSQAKLVTDIFVRGIAQN